MSYGRASFLVSLAVLSVFGASGMANAADLRTPSVKDSDASFERMPTIWQGWYLGLTVGASGGGVDVEKIGKKHESDIDGPSISIAPVAGYNFTNGPWVWGVEVDVNGAGFDEKKNIAGLGTLTAEASWYGSLRLRGGFAWDRLMIYGTGGLALADLEIKSSLGGKESIVSAGFAGGLGAEYAIDEHWMARAEGLIYSFADDTVKLGGSPRDLSWGHATLRLGATRRF